MLLDIQYALGITGADDADVVCLVVDTRKNWLLL